MKLTRLNRARDEAMERVGRALYGQQWIGELKPKEWEIGKFRGDLVTALPSSGRSAAAKAAARFRTHGSELQYVQVCLWLHEQGIDYSPASFDAVTFEAWFRKKFPRAQNNSTASRLSAVRILLNKGQRPGRGGNTSWKSFATTYARRVDSGVTTRQSSAMSRPFAPLVE